jgi:RNase P subunit RPR2
MSASDAAAHLNYLSDAAHLLAFTAPETSSYLMTQRDGLMFANELEPSTTQRQHVCGACGRIMILGHSSTLKLEAKELLRTKRSRHTSAVSKACALTRSDARAVPSKVFTCEGCGRYTRVQLPAPAPIPRKKMASPAVTKTVEAAKQPASANANSKKRAKNRKAGLQALLSQSQAGSSSARSGLGLSLSDFMKK